MKTSDNIYAYTRTRLFADHPERITGGSAALALVIFAEPLSDGARNALEKSLDAIGFGPDERAYACLDGLSSEDAFDTVEGLDPLVLVAADEKAANCYAAAVRQPFPLMRQVRVFGREARAFPLLNDMVQDEADKQAVWHLLKSLA